MKKKKRREILVVRHVVKYQDPLETFQLWWRPWRKKWIILIQVGLKGWRIFLSEDIKINASPSTRAFYLWRPHTGLQFLPFYFTAAGLWQVALFREKSRLGRVKNHKELHLFTPASAILLKVNTLFKVHARPHYIHSPPESQNLWITASIFISAVPNKTTFIQKNIALWKFWSDGILDEPRFRWFNSLKGCRSTRRVAQVQEPAVEWSFCFFFLDSSRSTHSHLQ